MDYSIVSTLSSLQAMPEGTYVFLSLGTSSVLALWLGVEFMK